MLTVAASVLIVGCAPMQQHPPTPDPTRACFDTALLAPVFSQLRTKIVLGLERPSLEMQADTNAPDQADRKVIIAYAQVRERCFQEGAPWRARYLPGTYRTLYDYGNGIVDASLSSLYRGDISFGRYNVNLESVRLDSRRKWDEAREIERRETDAARRQAALSALTAFPPPPPRPAPTTADTNCQVFGSQVYCTTTTR